MDRRDLLLKEPPPKRQELVNEESLARDVDKAAAFEVMASSRGWKMLLEDFINPRISIDILLQKRGPFGHAETRGSVKALRMLLDYINGTIKEGQKAHETLEVLKKRGR